MKGQLHPGDQLPTENELAEQFGVSRTVVREAIKAMSIQGLVEAQPGRGTYVTQPPLEIVTNNLHLILTLEDSSFDDLLVARTLLEIPITRLAAQNATRENIAVLQAHLEAMRASFDDPVQFIHHDTAFHAELARATQNNVLSILVQPLVEMLPASRQALARVPDMVARAYTHHERIFSAIAERDGANAEAFMRDHLAQVATDIERARRMEGNRARGGTPADRGMQDRAT